MANLRLDPADVVVPTEDALITAVDGYLVALRPQEGSGIVLNASAALIHTTFDGVRPVAAVVDQLVEETGLDQALIESDVRATVARLLAAGLVKVAGSMPAGARPVHAPAGAPARPGSSAGPPVPPDPQRWRPAIERLLAEVAWAFERTGLAVAGTACRVRADSPDVAALLEPLLAPLAQVGGGPAPAEHVLSVVTGRRGGEPCHRVVLDGRVVARVSAPEEAVVHALHHLDVLAVDATPGAVLFHAGAVERDGRVVIVLGISGKGKSTLTAALVQRGFRYLSDEVVAVDAATLRAIPYPKALDLDDASVGLLGLAGPDRSLGSHKGKVLPSTLGQVSSGGMPALLAFLAETPNQPEPGRAPVEPVPPAEALLALLPVTFEQTVADAEHFDAMGELCERVPAIRVGRATLEATIATIEAAL